MSIRGRVLRDPSASGPGLLVVEGQQFSFSLDGTWKSLTLPKAGLDVEVELNRDGTVSSLVAVPESQLAREKADRALNAARENASVLVASAVARIGASTLIATGVLVVGWFFLNTVTYDAGMIGRIDVTFWQLLALLNSSNGVERLVAMRDIGTAGIYGLLAWLALAGPFLGAFWNDRRAKLGPVLPFAFMLLVAVATPFSLVSKTSGMPAEMVDAARDEIRKGISLGTGAYTAMLAALYLGFNGVKRFLAPRK